jgi:hypothetical protein
MNKEINLMRWWVMDGCREWGEVSVSDWSQRCVFAEGFSLLRPIKSYNVKVSESMVFVFQMIPWFLLKWWLLRLHLLIHFFSIYIFKQSLWVSHHINEWMNEIVEDCFDPLLVFSLAHQLYIHHSQLLSFIINAPFCHSNPLWHPRRLL